MASYSSPKFYLPFGLGIAGIIAALVSAIIDINNDKIVQITWLASLLIVIATLTMRFYSIDSKGFADTINNDVPEELHRDGIRYLNWMTIAMIVGLLATIVIYFNFIFGMITYLLMHICLLVAFSGLYPLSLDKLRTSGYSNLKQLVNISVGFWVLAIVLDYTIFVYNGADSLIVIPYVVMLGTMASYTWYGLAYQSRSKAFRSFPVIASALFVFSDSIIGASTFGPFNVSPWLVLIIDLTYVINLFFMSQAMLFQGPLK